MANNKTDFWYNDNKYDALTGEAIKLDKSESAMHKAALLRAVSNFVNIVTGESIPVKFNTRDASYTDGKQVVIAGNISDKNFDHTVGLALHEGSHCKLTDFNVLQNLMYQNDYFASVDEDDNITPNKRTQAVMDKYSLDFQSAKWKMESILKDLLNVIEDRRIDMHIFKNAPGYKGYYQAMYDKYFNARVIDKALKTNQKTEINLENYMFHIINITNKNRNLEALPGLKDIWNAIDLKNISRITNTAEALNVAFQVFDIIEANLPAPQSQEQEPECSGNDQSEDNDDCENNSNGNQEDNTDCNGNTDTNSESSDEASEGNCSKNITPGQEPTQELSAKDEHKLQNAIQKQKQFNRGQITKSNLSKNIAKSAESIASEPITEYQSSEFGSIRPLPVTVIERINMNIIESGAFSSAIYKFGDRTGRYADAVNKGLQIGKALGNKLQLRNRETIETSVRQRKGKVDGRALARLGFDDPSVFAKTIITQNPDEDIHITIDASGSMSGERMNQTLTATAAIAQALKMTTNMHLTVSLRSEAGNNPLVVMIYDSSKDTINHIRSTWQYINCGSMTPESLCFGAIAKYLKPNTTIINFSDGMPGTNGNYFGWQAVEHCKREVKKWKHAGHTVLSFFVDGGYSDNAEEPRMPNQFPEMFGKESAKAINVTNIVKLARELNKTWAVKA